jgi:hypothetical protein
MSDDQIEVLNVSAAEARDHVVELEAERALAASAGIADIDSYKHDLELEIRIWRRLYVTSAVTEIATLRGELFGPQLG